MTTVTAVSPNANTRSMIICRHRSCRSSLITQPLRVTCRLFASLQNEDASLPGRHVEEQAARLQIVAVPIIPGRVELILDAPFLAGQIRKRQPRIALALIRRVVDGDDQPLHRFSPSPLRGRWAGGEGV